MTAFATRYPGRSAPAHRTALDGQLQGYLDHLAIERGVAANTLSSYRRDLRRYADHLAQRGIGDLGDVTEADVSDFLVALRKGDLPESERLFTQARKTLGSSAVSASPSHSAPCRR